MDRRHFLKRLGLTAAGLAIATTPQVEEVTRRFWTGWRASTDVAFPIARMAIQAEIDDVATGVWGMPWTDKGVTRDGLHFRMAGPMLQDVRIDQELEHDPVLRVGGLVELGNDGFARPLQLGYPVGRVVAQDLSSGEVTILLGGLSA